MDVLKVQKLNQMAQNLKKHNIVCDKESAIANAAKIYGQEYNYSDEENTMYNNENNELRKEVRKLTFALKNTVNELHEIKLNVGKLSRELNDLRVNQKPKRPVQKVIQKPVLKQGTPVPVQNAPPIQEHQTQQTTFAQPKEKLITTPETESEINNMDNKANAPIDRNGISPSDVAIDKMFYFGQK